VIKQFAKCAVKVQRYLHRLSEDVYQEEYLSGYDAMAGMLLRGETDSEVLQAELAEWQCNDPMSKATLDVLRDFERATGA